MIASMTTSSDSAAPAPFVAVVIPCRNEARFIRPVIDSLLASAHPRDRLEVFFVDGMSTDGTRAILADAAREHAFIRVLDNPRKITPVAMNLGIKAARGEIIVRLDAHSEYPSDYIPRCVELLRSRPNVGSAGGRIVPLPNGESPWARAVAFVTTHRFGVGGAAFRTGARPGFVDTVPGGAFRRDVLEEVGLYDERLTRNQDNELNARLREAGYRIVFDPRIRVLYRNQPSLSGLVRQAYFTGMWNVYTLSLHSYTWKWRRFIPMMFVAYLTLLAAAAAARAPATGWAALPLGLYAVLAGAFSLGSGRGGGGRIRVAATFVSYHLTYGAGTILGIANVLSGRWRADLGLPLSK
jgi:cellulose synthase/poly-beta-1,6-N-acetylglucosamine synthase-like glycosyltransferase